LSTLAAIQTRANAGISHHGECGARTLDAAQHHRVRLGIGKQLAGVTTIRPEQQELVDAVGVEKPAGRRVRNAVFAKTWPTAWRRLDGR